MIFFTSDTHFGHFNVIKYCNRPFTRYVEEIEHFHSTEGFIPEELQAAKFLDTAQMNEHMVAKWNEAVKPEDTVYFLGDFSLSKKLVLKFAPRLNGTKHLISGNHDACHPIHYKNSSEKGQNMRKLYFEAGFSSITTELKMDIAGHTVKLHHMPYASDHTKDERYKELRPKNDGGWLLHGHVHDLWKIKDKQINVGVDVWDFSPVPITDIEKIILGSS